MYTSLRWTKIHSHGPLRPHLVLSPANIITPSSSLCWWAHSFVDLPKHTATFIHSLFSSHLQLLSSANDVTTFTFMARARPLRFIYTGEYVRCEPGANSLFRLSSALICLKIEIVLLHLLARQSIYRFTLGYRVRGFLRRHNIIQAGTENNYLVWCLLRNRCIPPREQSYSYWYLVLSMEIYI